MTLMDHSNWVVSLLLVSMNATGHPPIDMFRWNTCQLMIPILNGCQAAT
jgi:hypothetical protein